ncbi:homeobox-leucine zipper protein HAT4-like isoform X1 [Rhodamnia argentea]|uniref:Homeobox-leucine zipper protein HAT4-like n=1 Tax=Rhodamnia argentea TaxID=178133 RepID=A0A8B8NQ83_9MYRT|nr:homeobox-leucine zipper protein HAT4-like isoform X1 [Rhodamnia argentea]XP_048141358.1 homeobox-leucine zipper protein HAT4-like isoform X1 [Rhodamnia argentea]
MGVEKDDLGLSLSLSYPHSSQASQLGLSPFGFSLHKHSQRERETFASLDRISEAEARPFLRGIDVNRPPPSTADCEEQEEAGASSPNSTISSVSGKRGEREMVSGGEDNEAERDCSRGGGGSDEEDGENSRKKLRLSKDQSAVLEESFREHNTLNPKQKLALAKQLGLRPRQVEVWFQNRRARTKLKQTEIDCEFLKRCCENLTEENRRLQKEVQELRALKLSPQFYMRMPPPTTLTMCPSCERLGPPPISSSAAGGSRPSDHHREPVPMIPWAARAGPGREIRGGR